MRDILKLEPIRRLHYGVCHFRSSIGLPVTLFESRVGYLRLILLPCFIPHSRDRTRETLSERDFIVSRFPARGAAIDAMKKFSCRDNA